LTLTPARSIKQAEGKMLALRYRLAVLAMLAFSLFFLTAKAYALWSSPVQLTNNDAINTSASLALDANGKAHLVYQSGEGTATEIYYATNATTDSAWKTVRLTNNSLIDLVPDIAVDDSGVPHIVYAADDPLSAGGDLEIVYRKKIGSGFTASDFSRKKLTSNSGYDASPVIALYKGRPFIAWEKVFSDGSDIELMFATYVNGSWVKRRLTNNSNKVQDEYPDIAVDGRGRARVVFQRKAGSYDSEIFQFLIVNPDTRYLKKLTDNTINDLDPHISIDSGKTYITYITQAGAVWLRRHIVGTGWLTPLRVVPKGLNTLPKVAAKNGVAYVAYTTLDSDAKKSLGMRYVTSANNWATSQVILNDSSETVADDFALASTGSLHLVYENVLFDANNNVTASSLNYLTNQP
jgi:hypothetical protein